MMKLRGYVIKETDKAILFAITEDICLHLRGLHIWFAKAPIRLPKRLHDKVISIYIPDWMYNEHIRYDEQTV
jgi:hypothetical protein